MTAGYSKTPLGRKLGLKPGGELVVIGGPDGYRALLEPLPDDAVVVELPAGSSAPAGARLLQVFFDSRAALAAALPGLRDRLAKDGALWISWPKKASGIASDLGGDGVRAEALAAGLVDVKVCAVDATWSGLKLVFRLSDR